MGLEFSTLNPLDIRLIDLMTMTSIKEFRLTDLRLRENKKRIPSTLNMIYINLDHWILRFLNSSEITSITLTLRALNPSKKLKDFRIELQMKSKTLILKYIEGMKSPPEILLWILVT